jgi:hypothetical protein
MSQPKLFNQPLPLTEIQRLAQEEFGNMVKFVVDLDRRVICAGGGLHSDEEAILLEDGSRQEDLWGANLYLDRPFAERVVYTSMINIRPRDGNRKQEITLESIRQKVRELADYFFKDLS